MRFSVGALRQAWEEDLIRYYCGDVLGYHFRLLPQFRHSRGFEQTAEQRSPDGKELLIEGAANTAVVIENKPKPVWFRPHQGVSIKPVQ